MKFCTNCGNQLDDNVKFCTKCGADAADAQSSQQNAQSNQQQSGNANQQQSGNVNQQQSGNVNQQQTQNNWTQQPFSADRSREQAGNSASSFPSQANTYTPPQYFGGDFNTTGKKKAKKGKKLLVSGIAAVLVIAMGTASVFAFPQVKNTALKTFLPANKYFAYVMKNKIEDTSSNIASLFRAFKNQGLSDQTISGSMSLSVGSELLDLIDKIPGNILGEAKEYIDWINNISFDYTTSGDMTTNKSVITAKVNNSEIISADLILDDLYNGGTLYCAFPDINKTTIAFDAADLGLDSSYYNTPNYQELFSSMPDEKEIKQMVSDYALTVIDEINVVQKSNDVLSAGAASKKYSSFSAEITPEVTKNIANAVLNKAKNDSTLEDIIKSAAEIANEDGDETYDDFIEVIDDALDSVSDIDFDEDISLKIWVDSVGDLTGLELSVDDESLRYADIEEKNSFNTSIELESLSGGFVIDGSGSISSGKRSGEYTLSVNDKSLLVLTTNNVNTKKLAEGRFEGSISLTPGSGLIDELNIPSVFSSFVSGINLTFEAPRSKNNNSESTLSVKQNETTLVSLDMSQKRQNGSTVTIPDDYIDGGDTDAISDWVKSSDFGLIVDRLKEAGIPSSLSSMLDEMLDEIDDGIL